MKPATFTRRTFIAAISATSAAALVAGCANNSTESSGSGSGAGDGGKKARDLRDHRIPGRRSQNA